MGEVWECYPTLRWDSAPRTQDTFKAGGVRGEPAWSEMHFPPDPQPRLSQGTQWSWGSHVTALVHVEAVLLDLGLQRHYMRNLPGLGSSWLSYTLKCEPPAPVLLVLRVLPTLDPWEMA